MSLSSRRQVSRSFSSIMKCAAILFSYGLVNRLTCFMLQQYTNLAILLCSTVFLWRTDWNLNEVKTIERVVRVGYSFVEVDPHGLHWPPWSQYTYSSIFPVKESEVSCHLMICPRTLWVYYFWMTTPNDHAHLSAKLILTHPCSTPLLISKGIINYWLSHCLVDII